MKMRTQLLLLNLISLSLLVGALLFSYKKMLLSYEQTQFLTVIALVAGGVSALAYGLMTLPVTQSLNRLIRLTEHVGQHRDKPLKVKEKGPLELRTLTRSFQQMDERLRKSFRRLEKAEQSRRELVANVSHDLRTPLANIRSYVEALQDGMAEEPETMKRYLDIIHKETLRLSSMIEDLFELSKLEAGKEVFEPVWSHLDQVLAEVLESHKLMLKEKRINMHVNLPDQLPPLLIMPQKIKRVVSNLLQNAIRHSPADGTIALHVRLLKDEVKVILRDEGEGVPETEHDRIFERFYRTDPSRAKKSGGAGLGLAIARSLIQLHAGRIGVRNREDGLRGSEFWFTLPLNGRASDIQVQDF